MSNLFIVEGDRLLTPALDRCGVAGVVREVILDYARKNDVVALEQPLQLQQLQQADGSFLTNSGFGVLPIGRVDDLQLPISPLIQQVASWLEEARRCEC